MAEGTPANQGIPGSPAALAPAAGDTLANALSGTDAGHFDIDAGSGRLKTRGVLDRAVKTSYSVVVTATYGSGASATITVTINVAKDYDTDNDGLIEVSSLAQLNGIRWDLDGDGSSTKPNYALVFPDLAVGMGCPDSDSDPDTPDCLGYELADDLDFDTHGGDDTVTSADTYWRRGAGWAPLGAAVLSRASEPQYNAIFEGNGFTISNMLINLPDRQGVGLCGALGPDGVIRNLGLVKATVTARAVVGTLAGLVAGTVESSYATGSVAGQGPVGGLVGSVPAGGGIVRSYTTAGVSGSGANVGGLAGSVLKGTIKASYAAGNVSGGGNTVGGLVGVLNAGTVTASYALGQVQGAKRVGGLVGRRRHGATVTDSYWDTRTSRQGSSAGGVGKTTIELQTPTQTDGYAGIYANWNIDLDGQAGADAPWDFGEDDEYPALKAEWDGNGAATAYEFGVQSRSVAGSVDYDDDDDGLIEVDSLAKLNALRWDLDGDGAPVWIKANAYALAFPNAATGMGCVLTDHDSDANSADQPTCTGYELTADLDFNTDTSSDSGGTVVIDRDDDYYHGGSGWEPLGDSGQNPFRATFDGNNHTISNLFINRTGSISNHIGLFGQLDGVTVRRGQLDDATVRRVHLADAKVTGNNHVGALVGHITLGIVSHSSSSGTVSGVDNVGGLVGTLYSTRRVVEYSHSSASVTSTGIRVGGLVGRANGSLRVCYATGAVTGANYVGGLAGYGGGAIYASYATGAVAATGIKLRIPGGYPGVEWLTDADGNIRGTTYAIAGGLAGSATDAIYASYSTGVTTSTEGDAHGLAWGLYVASYAGSYWDVTTSGIAADDDVRTGVGKTTTDLQSPTQTDGYAGIYATWNIDVDDADDDDVTTTGIDAPWDFGTVNEYPALKADSDSDGKATAYEFGRQGRSVPVVAPPPANTAPEFGNGADTSFLVAENTGANKVVGTVNATDAELDTLVYALDTTSTDHAAFTLDTGSGELTLTAEANFEGKPSYSIRVTVHDGKNAAGAADTAVDDTIAVTVTVDDVDEPPDKPSAPTVSAASISSLNVSWSPPANKGPAITDYDYRYKKTSENSWTEVTGGSASAAVTAVIASLESGTPYDVQVRATNPEGTGEWSATTSATVSATVPAAVDNLAATAASATAINLTWTAPGNGGSAIISYSLERKKASGSYTLVSSTIAADATSYADSSLAPGTAYAYRIRAVNAVGSGTWSNEPAAATPAIAPEAVDDLAATATSATAIDLTWTAPDDGGKASPATTWSARRRPGATPASPPASRPTPQAIRTAA